MITIFQVRLTKCKHYEFALNLIERNIQPIMFQCFVKNNKNYQKSYPYDNKNSLLRYTISIILTSAIMEYLFYIQKDVI